MPSYRKWRNYRYALAGYINGRLENNYGDDGFYRRAIRPHEIFLRYSIKEITDLINMM